MLYSKNGEYPATLPFRIRLSNGLTRTDPSTFTEEELADAGYVAAGEIPSTTDSQVLEWTGSAWATRDKTQQELLAALSARKEEMRKTVDQLRDATLQGGFTPTSGPLSGKTLQTRNLEDRTNWLISQTAYSRAVAGGMGEVTGATFRTADNETVICTFNEGLAALTNMIVWGQTIMTASWNLKDAIEQATDLETLMQIDLTF